ncbi:hypothetical protein PN4B1_17030 [Paenibacillus naphthalenovorans]|nr:hypothetical protein PN4B1_17030 [Paenibacillus naphthalenovorans]
MTMYLGVRGVDNKIRNVDDSNGYPVKVTGNIIKDSWSGSATNTRTFTTPMTGFAIVNRDASTALTFTINGITITVDPKEPFDGKFDPFTSVTITTTVAYKAVVMG